MLCLLRYNWKFEILSYFIFLDQEHFDLYRWRENFFFREFGPYYEENCSWTCEGGDDSHAFDTVPLQVEGVKFDSANDGNYGTFLRLLRTLRR